MKKETNIIYDNSNTITDLINNNKSLEDILELYNNNQIDFLYEKRWNHTNKILQDKEKYCDIKISDFIKENFNKHRLFVIENHPTSIVFIHLVNKILKLRLNSN